MNKLTQIADLSRKMVAVGSATCGLADFMLNDYVIVRTEASGVHYGKVADFDATRKQLLLADARRIYSWEKEWTLHEVSLNGFTQGHVSQPIPLFFVCDVCELIPCSEAAIKAINSITPYGEELERMEDDREQAKKEPEQTQEPKKKRKTKGKVGRPRKLKSVNKNKVGRPKKAKKVGGSRKSK